MLLLIGKRHSSSSSSSASRMTTTSLQMPLGMTNTTHLVGSSAPLLRPTHRIQLAMAIPQQQQPVRCLQPAVQLLLCLQFAAHQLWQLAMQLAPSKTPLQDAPQQQRQINTLAQQQRTSKL
jgi:hypothetical protein